MAVQGGMGPGGPSGYVADPPQWSQLTAESHILGAGQYDYGDMIHDHHRRHHHRFHDHHYVQGAHECLDLSNVPQVQSHVIPAQGGAGAEFQLRPDVFGKWAFENGASQYGFGMGFTGPMTGGGGGMAAPPQQPMMASPMMAPPMMATMAPPSHPPHMSPAPPSSGPSPRTFPQPPPTSLTSGGPGGTPSHHTNTMSPSSMASPHSPSVPSPMQGPPSSLFGHRSIITDYQEGVSRTMGPGQ